MRLRVRSDVELQLEICFVSVDLKWLKCDDLGTVESPDELVAADTQLALSGLNLVILHPSGFISHGTINPLTGNWDGGGDVPHRISSLT